MCRREWKRIFDRHYSRQRRALMGKAQQFESGAFRQKCDDRKVAAQHAKDIELAMRQIIDLVAIEIEGDRAVPIIADAGERPAIRAVLARDLDGMQIARERVRGKTVLVRV